MTRSRFRPFPALAALLALSALALARDEAVDRAVAIAERAIERAKALLDAGKLAYRALRAPGRGAKTLAKV